MEIRKKVLNGGNDMRKLLLRIILIIVLISTVFMAGRSQITNATTEKVYLGAKKNFKQKIDVYPEPLNYNRGKLLDIDEAYNENREQYDLKGYDISELDLTEIKFERFIFDSETKWPEKLPEGFDVETIIDYGKQPGLDIDYIHKQNITGKGVNVGIIDGRLLVDHKEFKDNIKVYEEIADMNGPAHYHGTPIASILGGKNIGVAPDANIYYIAYLDENTDYEDGYVNLANAIEKMVDINKSLSEDNKIRVLSISSGWDPSSKNAQAILSAIEKAKEENIFVITAELFETDNLFFGGVNRDAMADPNNIESYSVNYYFPTYDVAEDILMVPMDARWLASPTGRDEYVMYSKGAWSMVIPYISGLYTLACEANPHITPDIFWELALSTGDTLDTEKQHYNYNDKNVKIVNPKKLISALTPAANN
jgi:tetratricopeptide (TPR) repeat protein